MTLDTIRPTLEPHTQAFGCGTTWLAYNDPEWLADRHGVDAGSDRTLHAMADFLAAVARGATAASAENGSAKV